MTALAAAGAPGSANQIHRVSHNGLYPEAKTGDFLIWQDVDGWRGDGLYMVSIGGQPPTVYLVQNCGGRIRLYFPARDINPKTREFKPDAKPQELTRTAFNSVCIGFVVAVVDVKHIDAFLGRETLIAAKPRKERVLEGAL